MPEDPDAEPSGGGSGLSLEIPDSREDPWAPTVRSKEERLARRTERRTYRRARQAARRDTEAELPTGLGYELRSLAELMALTGWAFVQPILGPFGESPETFVGAGASGREVVGFALMVAVVPLAILVALAAASRLLGPRVRRSVQSMLMGVLGALGAVSFARGQGVGSLGRLIAGLTVGAALVVIHRRWEPGKLFLRYAAPTPIILVMAFLVASPVASIVSPPNIDSVDQVASTRADHPDVVVLVLDELPTLSLVDGDGQIDRERFANIGRFADTSTWFRNHSSVAPETLLALPALVTSKFPTAGNDEQFADYDSYPDNIFTLLGRTHEVHAVEWATDLCPPSVCTGGTTGLDATSRSLIRGRIDRPDPVAATLATAKSFWVDQVWPFTDGYVSTFAFPGSGDSVELARPGLQFLSELEPPAGDRPVFDWLDVGMPHQPWRLLPSGIQYNGPQGPPGSAFLGWPDAAPGRQLGLAARTSHLLQLQWADRMLGAIFDRLDKIDRFDDALVILTADHGVSFTPGEPIRDLSPGNATQISYPPLFVKAPGQTVGTIDDGNALSLDLLPTVADYTNVTIPWEMDGLSLRDGATREDPSKLTVSDFPDRFPRRVFGDVVQIDADGLSEIKQSPFVTESSPAGLGADGLNVYRHGRFGNLVGQRVADLEVCDGGPKVDYRPPSDWNRWTDGELSESTKVPLFHTGRIDGPGSRDVAIVVDGAIAGWAPSRPDEGGNPFGVLLAEPLAGPGAGEPEVYEIRDFDGCDLRRFAS